MAIEIERTFKLTNDDIVIDNTRNIALIEGNDKLVQDFDVLLRTEKGEDIFRTEFGMGSLSMINEPTEENIVGRVRDALNLYRFTQVIEDVTVTFDPDNRAATVSATIVVDDEEVTITTGVQF